MPNTRFPMRRSARFALALLAACAAPAPPADSATQAAAVARDAIFARHDLDHDGRVTAAEYDRGAESFAHLDRDGDGVITAADFDAPVPMPPRFAVPMLLIRTFGGQAAESVTWAQVQAGFAALDADGDGRVSRAEFEAPLAGHASAGPDRFSMLVAAMDADHDGEVSREELRADFGSRDLDGNGVLERLERPRSGPAPRVGWFAAGDRDTAPDFSLPRVQGEGRVALSALRGRPVVLIFGSFS